MRISYSPLGFFALLVGFLLLLSNTPLLIGLGMLLFFGGLFAPVFEEDLSRAIHPFVGRSKELVLSLSKGLAKNVLSRPWISGGVFRFWCWGLLWMCASGLVGVALVSVLGSALVGGDVQEWAPVAGLLIAASVLGVGLVSGALFRPGTAVEGALGEVRDRRARQWLERANAALTARDYKRAAGCFSAALELKHDLFEALNDRAVAYNALDRHKEALADCDRALALRPNYPAALNNRGLAYYHLGHHRAASADWLGARRAYQAAGQASMVALVDHNLELL